MTESAKNNILTGAEANEPFRIIGVGTSAGGLEALTSFFASVPDHFAHAIVIVQHLSPDYKSMMAELLGRVTTLPIHEVEDSMVVEGGSVYLIPPRKNMTMDGGHLRLVDKPKGHDLNLPIDIFFRSLAAEQGDRAIGVILSGSGSDGARGMRAIKEAGGTIVVQEPEEAQFDGMPKSAISSGLVDFVVPAKRIGAEILEYLSNPHITGAGSKSAAFSKETYDKILHRVNEITQLNFAEYKRPTLERRLLRRMSITKHADMAGYYKYLTELDSEADTLAREFLIGVTKFFRDEHVWATLESRVIPEIVKNKTDPQEPIRVWIVGCSTGEEAYSIAILLHEEIKRQKKNTEVKIFATDIHRGFVEMASRGCYTESIVADVNPRRLARYFRKTGEDFQITEEIRNMVVFSQHNILEDPPFNHTDLVMCRNLLIYLDPVAQQGVIQTLHYSLKLNSVLVLGSSETVGDSKPAFTEIDRKGNIFRNTEIIRAVGRSIKPYRMADNLYSHGTRQRAMIENRLADFMNDTVADEIGAAGVFIDENYEILHVIGNFRRYIALPEKGFSFNLLKVLPGNLSIAVSTAVRKAMRDGEKVLYKGLKLINGEHEHLLNFVVRPVDLDGNATVTRYFVLLLPENEKSERTGAEVAHEAPVDENASKRIAELQYDLDATRESLQSTIEEVQTSNEELQATNEELIASNEELQSTNEELQSVNEELHTVNAEHQRKLELIDNLNTEMNHLLQSTEIGTVFLDNALTIKRVTSAIYTHFNLRESDLGRPITDFSSEFENMTTEEMSVSALRVATHGRSLEAEVRHKNGRWYLQRINPYIGAGGQADGVVVSYVDITEQKELQLFNQGIMDSAINGVYIYNAETGNNDFVNKRYSELTGYSLDEINMMSQEQFFELFHPQDQSAVGEHMQQVLANRTGDIDPIVYRFRHAEGHWIWLLSYDSCFERNEKGEVKRFIGSFIDISDRKNLEEELTRSNTELGNFASLAAHDLQSPLRTISGCADLLKKDYSDALDDAGRKSLDFMAKASARMHEQVQGLLEYARLGQEVFKESIDLNQIVREIRKELESEIAKNAVMFSVEGLPAVLGVKNEIHILFQNLITNAIKFQREGVTPEIIITAEHQQDFWEIRVSDNGIGIAPEDRQNVFKLFKRLQKNGDYTGSGIGLAHCAKVVELHGGQIHVESTLGKGSTFIFTLAAG